MKTFKEHITKFLAIAISVVYIIAPVHNEVKSVLHNIYHGLEMPDAIMTHDLEKEHTGVHKKLKTCTIHDHEIMNLFDAFFGDNTNKKDSNDPYSIVDKIDKHISSTNDIRTKFELSLGLKITDSYRELKKEMFLKKIKIPPQSIS